MCVYIYTVYQKVLSISLSIFVYPSISIYPSILRSIYHMSRIKFPWSPYIIVFQRGPCSILNHPKPMIGICCFYSLLSLSPKISDMHNYASSQSINHSIWGYCFNGTERNMMRDGDFFNPSSQLSPGTTRPRHTKTRNRKNVRLDHGRGCCERTGGFDHPSMQV